jgi:hypothetical protein
VPPGNAQPPSSPANPNQTPPGQQPPGNPQTPPGNSGNNPAPNQQANLNPNPELGNRPDSSRLPGNQPGNNANPNGSETQREGSANENYKNSLAGKLATALGMENAPPSELQKTLVEAIGERNLDKIARITDLAASLTPGVSAVKDVYELATGNNVVTGEKLTTLERGIALVGVLSLGTSSSLIHGTEALARVARGAEEARGLEKVVAEGTHVAEGASHIAGDASSVARTAEEWRGANRVASEAAGGARAAENTGRVAEAGAGTVYREATIARREVEALERDAANNGRTWAPFEKGPLGNPGNPKDAASSFRGGTYTQKVAQEEMYVYRDFGGTAKADGRFATLQPSSGPLQSRMDSAILQEWNSMGQRAVIRIPKGTTYYEGFTAAQTSLRGTDSYLGGGVQVFLREVDPSWVSIVK